MSDSQQKPWSDNRNAPNITYFAYFSEKAGFSGYFVSLIFYGIVIVVFFQCMTGLFSPVHRRGEPVKWGFVFYTVVMFSLVTVLTATNLDIFSISYIDNRQFPGGPGEYISSVLPMAFSSVPDAMTVLSNWLTDGLLLYRCYVIYSTNLWVIALPCLMYLGSVALGIILIRRTTEVFGALWPVLAYLSISVSLNVLLTFMIVIRLVLYIRNTRTALGITGAGGLCKAVVTMLVESCALYSVSSLLVLGPMSTGTGRIANFFIPILPETQAIASLLIIQRVANKSALTNNTIVSGHLDSFKVRSHGWTTGIISPLPGGDSASSMDRRGVGSDDLGIETTIE